MRHTPFVAFALLLTLAGCGRSAMPLLQPGVRTSAPNAAKETMTPRREKAVRLYVKDLFDREADLDHNGKVTRAEWEHRSYGMDAFKRADTDHNGTLDFDEYLVFSDNMIQNQIRTNESGFKILLSQADRNHDGHIMGKELVYKPNQHRSTDYNVVDFNHDGEFTVDEYCDGYLNLMAGLEPSIPM